MNYQQHPAARAPGHEHIPIYPRGFIAIRIVQLVLAILILALAAYSVALLAYDGNSFILAVAVMTFITSIYQLVARFNAPAIYNYWAILSLDIFFVVMWLASFALLASRVAAWFSLTSYSSSYSSYYSSYYSSSYYGLSSTDYIWLACQAAAASLGGLEFVLYLVSLIIHSIRLHRHRAAGLHCMPGVAPTPPAPFNTDKPAGPPVYYTQQPPYPPQQPVPVYQPHPGHPQQHPQQQGYPMQPYPMPVPVPGYQQQHQQQHPHPQQQQHQQPHPQQQQQQQQQPGFYGPQPTQSPAPTHITPEYTNTTPSVNGQGPTQLPTQLPN